MANVLIGLGSKKRKKKMERNVNRFRQWFAGEWARRELLGCCQIYSNKDCVSIFRFRWIVQRNWRHLLEMKWTRIDFISTFEPPRWRSKTERSATAHRHKKPSDAALRTKTQSTRRCSPILRSPPPNLTTRKRRSCNQSKCTRTNAQFPILESFGPQPLKKKKKRDKEVLFH